MKAIIPLLLMSGISQATELRTKIAVVDTGINQSQSLQRYMCEDGVKNMTNYKRSDSHGHGSHIVHIIGTRIDTIKYCIVSYKVYDRANGKVLNNTIKALRDIKKSNYKFVNISMSGGYDAVEFNLMTQIINGGTKIVVAAGNDKLYLTRDKCKTYPACYKIKKNYYVVSAYDVKHSNKGSFTIKERGRNISSYGGKMSGSSQATAIYTSKLIKRSDY